MKITEKQYERKLKLQKIQHERWYCRRRNWLLFIIGLGIMALLLDILGVFGEDIVTYMYVKIFAGICAVIFAVGYMILQYKAYKKLWSES